MRRRIAAAGVTGLAALGMITSPAQADGGDIGAGSAAVPPAGEDYCQFISWNNEVLGRGCFYHYGDRIWVKDEKADGRRAVVEYKFDYDRPAGECHAAGGAGTTNECNENMWEQGRISFRVVIRNGSEPPNDEQGAWSPWLNIG